MNKMNHGILAAVAAVVLFTTPVLAGGVAGGSQPSADWNANYNHNGANAKQFELNRALAIKQAEDGGFGTTVINNSTSTTTVDIHCDSPETCNTAIDTQNNLGAQAIGAQIIVDGDNNVVTDNTNENLGPTSAGNALVTGGNGTGVDNTSNGGF